MKKDQTLAVVTAFLALFAIVGFALYGLPRFYPFFVQELGWSRQQVTSGNAYSKVIIALLFGVLTDYLVFFVSGFRTRLERGESARDAASAVTAELLPVVSTAALMIAGATLTLTLAGVDFLSAFGPAMAISVLVAVLVALAAESPAGGGMVMLPSAP